MPELWTLHIAPDVARTLYTLPRGQVIHLRDALAQLRKNPRPKAARQLIDDELPGLYSVEIAGFLIEYQIIESEGIVRVLSVD